MSDIPTNKPLGILKTSNRNDNFKIPSAGVSKPEKEKNESRHSNTTPHPKTPRPTKAVNDENINPNKHFPESTTEMSNIIKETPGKTMFDLCNRMSALALLTPDGMQQSIRDTQAQPKKVKLPFSEPFAGVDKLTEKNYLSNTEEIELDNVPRKTLVITDDDEFFTDAAEYFKNENLNIDNTSDNDAFKSLESSPRTSLNVTETLMKNNNSGERDSESAIIGTDKTQEASLQEKISNKNIHERLEYTEPGINSDLFNKAIHNQNIGNLSESHENKNPSSQVICIESETVAELHAEDFTNLPKDAELTNSTDIENGDYLKNKDENSDSIPVEKPVLHSSVNVIQSVEMANDSSDPLTMESYILQSPVDEKQNTDILDTCKVEEKIAEISIPEKFDNFNDQDKSKDKTPDSGVVDPPEISNQVIESVDTGSTKTDKYMSDSKTTLKTVQTDEKISEAKETVDSFETEIANCLTSREKTPEEKSSDIVEYFECSSKIDTANVDAEKTEENNSNLLESQNVDCSHGSPKPQSTEEGTCENAHLAKTIDNASVTENVEINKPVADTGSPVDEKPVLHSSVNVMQSVAMPNDSSDPLTMESYNLQSPVNNQQDTDILKVEEKIAEISIPEKFDNSNDQDKSKDGTPDSGSVDPSKISNQVNESQNVDCSHESPKPQSTEEDTCENAHLLKAIDNASVTENVEINKPVADIGSPVDEKPVLHSSVNVMQSVETPKNSSDPLTMESYNLQPPADKKQDTDILKVEEKIAEISVPEKFNNSNDQDKSKGGTPDSGSVDPSEISNQVNESVATCPNVEIKKPVGDVGRPEDIEEEVMESSEVKDAIDHSKINCEIPNSIAASDDDLQKFETISNSSVFKDVDTFSTNTHLPNSPISIEGSQSNIDISFEGRTQMATSPNKQQQVGNEKHADSQSRQNINEKPNRKELNEITDLVIAIDDTCICEDDISTTLKDAEPSDGADTANYDEQEPHVQFREKTTGFICDDDDWELLNCDKTVMNASRLCRESLYVKFDPLLGLNNTIDFDINKTKNVSKQPALEKIKSPPQSPDLIMMDSPTRKSMYQKVTAMRKANNSTNNNLDDIFSLSPANNNPDAVFFGTPLPQKKNSEIVQVLKYTEEDWLKMKQNIELEYQNRLMSASKELTHKMSEITEEHQKALNEKDVEIEQVKKDLLQLQTEKKAGQEKLTEMKKVLDEYTILIDHLAAEKQKCADDYTKGIDGSKKEVDLIQDELQTVQKAYSDLHRRFEKAKTIIESLKKNEEMLKNHVKDMVAKVKEGKVALVTLKKESQETQANLEKEVAALKKKLTIDTSCLEASSKRKDMKIAELQNELELKKNQIKELTKICDDLMEKVGDGQ